MKFKDIIEEEDVLDISPSKETPGNTPDGVTPGEPEPPSPRDNSINFYMPTVQKKEDLS